MVTMYDETGMDLFMQPSGLHGPQVYKTARFMNNCYNLSPPKKNDDELTELVFTVWMSCLSPNQQLQRK